MRFVAATFVSLGALASLARGAPRPQGSETPGYASANVDAFLFDRIRANVGFATFVMREVAKVIDETDSADLAANVLYNGATSRAIPRPIWEPTNTYEGATPRDKRWAQLGYPGQKPFVMYNKYGFPQMKGLPPTITPAAKGNLPLVVGGEEEQKLLSLMSRVREIASTLAPVAQIPRPPARATSSPDVARWLEEVSRVLGAALLADLKVSYPLQPLLPYHRPRWVSILTKLRDLTVELQAPLIFEKSTEMQRYSVHFLAVRESLKDPALCTIDGFREPFLGSEFRADQIEDRDAMKATTQELAKKVLNVDFNLINEM